MLVTSAIFVFQIKQVKATGKTSGEWWNNDWIYRKLITINSSQVDSTLYNFPVLINLESDSDLVAHAQPDGDDIAFVLDSDNTQLNHEIETFNATTGELICWVNVTSLSNTVDTMLWMYYGNPSAANQQNPCSTWDSNYVGVWHMNQIPGNGEMFYDSTCWNNDGTMSDSNNNSIQVAGTAGYAVDFNGDADYLTVIDDTELQVTCYFTLEIWFNKDSWSTKARPFSYWHSSLDKGWLTQYDTDRTPKLYVGDGSVDTFDPTLTMPTAGNWGYSAFSFNNKAITGYVNKDCQTDTLSYCSTSHNNNLFIARSYTSTDYFAGSIDEVRYSNIARDQSWINATYDTIANPSSFFSVGSEEMQSNIKVSDPYPADGAIDVELTPIMSINVNHSSGNGTMLDHGMLLEPIIMSSMEHIIKLT
jgi:MSHA biogenesis protein MshQ